VRIKRTKNFVCFFRVDQNVVTEANAAFFALFKWGQVPPCPRLRAPMRKYAHFCGFRQIATAAGNACETPMVTLLVCCFIAVQLTYIMQSKGRKRS